MGGDQDKQNEGYDEQEHDVEFEPGWPARPAGYEQAFSPERTERGQQGALDPSGRPSSASGSASVDDAHDSSVPSWTAGPMRSGPESQREGARSSDRRANDTKQTRMLPVQRGPE